MCGCGVVVKNTATGVATNTFYDTDGTLAGNRAVNANNLNLAINNIADLTLDGNGAAGSDANIVQFEDINLSASAIATVLVGSDGLNVVTTKSTLSDAAEVEVFAPLVEIGSVAGGNSVKLIGYPSSRDDNATVTNFLGTDADGDIVSMPVADINALITAALPAVQRGSQALSIGVTSQAIVLGTPLANATYGLFITVRNVTDANPTTIAAVVSAKSTTGFTVEFSAVPTANYVLDWFVYP